MGRLLGALALGIALWVVTAPSAAAEPLDRALLTVVQMQAAGAGAAATPTDSAPVLGVADAVRAVLADPNVAFLLLIVGAIGLIAEVYHPGAFVPGIVGIIAFLLGIVALGTLPTNWGAVGLVLFSLLLFVLELHLPSHGVLGAGAVVAFLLGGLLLFAPLPGGGVAPPAELAAPVEVNRWLLGVVGAMCSGFFLLVLRLGLRARRLPVTDPLMRLTGACGITASALMPGGTVRVLNESWSAESVGAPIPSGERVEVVARDGLTLRVRRLSPILVNSGDQLPSQGEVRPGVQVVQAARVERTG